MSEDGQALKALKLAGYLRKGPPGFLGRFEPVAPQGLPGSVGISAVLRAAFGRGQVLPQSLCPLGSEVPPGICRRSNPRMASNATKQEGGMECVDEKVTPDPRLMSKIKPENGLKRNEAGRRHGMR